MAKHMCVKTPDLPSFQHNFHVLRDRLGECFILEEDEHGEVMRVSINRVNNAIQRYIAESRFPLGFDKLVAKDMKSISAEFMAIAPYIADPAMVLEQSCPGLTYRKLPFDFAAPADGTHGWPTFLEMMGRTTNALPLMHWIGSLFDPDADMQQYVWLHGGGQNGKSALGRFLSRVLGSGAISVQPPAIHDRFWAVNLVGKRLVIYGDCNNAKFVTSGIFKSMTGGDAISAEIKNGATLQVVLKAKHLFFSNKKPGIDGGEADQRRIILCEMAGIDCEPDPAYEDRLWVEAPVFLNECLDLYRSDVGPRRRIKCDQTAARELALENDEDLEILFAANFLINDKAHIEGAEMQKILYREGMTRNSDIKRFKEFLQAHYGVFKVKNAGRYVYRGLCRALPPSLVLDD